MHWLYLLDLLRFTDLDSSWLSAAERCLSYGRTLTVVATVFPSGSLEAMTLSEKMMPLAEKVLIDWPSAPFDQLALPYAAQLLSGAVLRWACGRKIETFALRNATFFRALALVDKPLDLCMMRSRKLRRLYDHFCLRKASQGCWLVKFKNSGFSPEKSCSGCLTPWDKSGIFATFERLQLVKQILIALGLSCEQTYHLADGLAEEALYCLAPVERYQASCLS